MLKNIHLTWEQMFPKDAYLDQKDNLPSYFDSIKGCNIYRYKIMPDGTEIVSGAWHIGLIICDTQEAPNYIDNCAQCLVFQNHASFLDMKENDFE